MAIAFARMNIHSRSHGHSAIAGAAYRAGIKLYDERTGETHNYQNRADILHTEIILPDGADEKFKNREFLWNAIEQCEKRKDAQIAKDVVLALPRHLSLEHHIALTRQFAQYHFVSKGLVADIAIHNHSDDNPHAHIYLTTRRLLGHEFDRHKARDLNPAFANAKGGKGFITEQNYWGEQWRDFQNNYFVDHHIDLMVDENLLISQRHQGRIRDNKASYIEEENGLKKQASTHIVLNDPDSLIKSLSHRYAVFSERQLASLIFKSAATQEAFQIAMTKIKSHREVVCLGISDKDGQLHYTTRANYHKETQLAKQAKILGERSLHKTPAHLIEPSLTRYSLNSEQQQALKHILKNKDIAIIVGHAGTGKSYLMKAAVDIWQKAGYKIQGIAVSGVAAKGLAAASQIPSSTLAYFKHRLTHGNQPLQSNHILIMDEAGMTDLHDMALVVDAVKQANAKLILIGDPNQLQPIGAGAPFRALIESVGFFTLGEIRRQVDPGDQKASRALALGKVSQALQYYIEKEAVHWHSTPSFAMENLIARWGTALSFEKLTDQLILAHRNADIQKLNQLARQKLISQCIVSPEAQTIEILKRTSSSDGWHMIFIKEKIELATGDRILFRRNDKALGVVNGDFGTIINIDKEQLTVNLDNQRKITFNPKNYNEFDYGYAVTVHKAQGATVDKVLIYAGNQGWNRHLAYVALTRHRKEVELHIDKENFASDKILKTHFSREEIKDNVLDWPINYAQRRNFDGESLTNRFIEKIGKLKNDVKNTWQFLTAQTIQHKKKKLKTKTRFYKTKSSADHKLHHINWHAPEYRTEWENLRHINNKQIQWMVKFYDLLRTQKNQTNVEFINKSLNNIAAKIAKNPVVFEIIKQKSEKLAEHITLLNKTIRKDKNLNRNL